MRVLAFLSTIAAAGMAIGHAQDPTLADASSFRISVNVDLVALPVTVNDSKGRPVSDLHQQDFEVSEDGVRQSIRLFRHEDIPVTVGLVIDHSGSMRPKMAEAIAAAHSFVHASNPNDEMFVVNFNEKVQVGLPPEIPFTNRFDQLELAIRRETVAGMTALYDAIFEALNRVGSGAREKKALVVISDGGDNASAHALPDVLKLAARSTAVVYTIGIFDVDDPDRNPGVLRRLASASGGEAFFPTSAEEIIAACENIARDMRSQYLIGYVPTPAPAKAGYRAIRVAVHAAGKGKLLARTRAGYFAGEAADGKEKASR